MEPHDWKELLTLLLAQRLELNAVESAVVKSGALTEAQLKEVRTQAANTARAWSARENDDVLTLLRVHSSPSAKMTVPEKGDPLI